ncbi:flagellar motor switch protein FliN [Arthrobacter bambusae]|uniref:flagellar motor switch protein FliN n=1 Tax=Arthrobacter bambusae TaxID=1338426 RepID=UPI00278AB606|nr:flagellar motor switch protein FliN [Arthrobacter bambusae]MDQ0029466.1 flagellar motor switch protein FliN/FliY [Arthrobacter bambusae]MDQ0097126.1 flagellar motor switch protein FliN/FliY [Arthrobacter bambusae]
MSITLTLHESAAERLAMQLPTPATLQVSGIVPPQAAASYAPLAVTATFVGAVTADFALILTDRSFLAAAGGGLTGAASQGGLPAGVGSGSVVSGVDILRPAMEHAAEAFDAGVLGELREEDGSGLLSDPETAVFELRQPHAMDGGQAFGWFAVRVREHGTVQDTTAPRRPQPEAASSRLGLISNVEMALTVEIGRTRMSVRDALALEPGKVIELDRSAGAPADVLLNGRLIAHGEVVVVDQDYAVRITRILDVAEGIY